jgi:predicted transcriptional regulator
MSRQPLEKPVRKRQVTKALLEGESQTAIAERHGVTQPAISLFAKRHAAELEAKSQELDDALVPMLYQSKERRLQELESLYSVAKGHVVDRQGFLVKEPKQLKDEVVYVERFDAAMYNALHRTLDDIAAEEGARTRGPVISVTNQVLIRAYDIGTDPSTV